MNFVDRWVDEDGQTQSTNVSGNWIVNRFLNWFQTFFSAVELPCLFFDITILVFHWIFQNIYQLPASKSFPSDFFLNRQFNDTMAIKTYKIISFHQNLQITRCPSKPKNLHKDSNNIDRRTSRHNNENTDKLMDGKCNFVISKVKKMFLMQLHVLLCTKIWARAMQKWFDEDNYFFTFSV